MFENFRDYMFYLLHGPLRKVIRKDNQFYIFFKVFGKVFDKTKEDIFKVREQSIILTASERMLEEHGADRGMKRYKDEDIERYRIRLLMKYEIALKAGINEGILLALKALGYESSRIEPYYKHDATKWAEFIVYLDGKGISNIRDLDIIDQEVMKTKPASSKPNYGTERQIDMIMETDYKTIEVPYPLCGTYNCGTHPSTAIDGLVLQNTGIRLETKHINSKHNYKMTSENTLTKE